MAIVKSRRGAFQVVQFSMIGVLNALVDIGSLNLLLLIWPTGDHEVLLLFNSIAYTLAIINSYIWNSRLTFRKHAVNNWREKTHFFVQAGISLLISNAVFLISIDILSLLSFPLWMIHNMAKGLAMFLSSTASFFFMKFFVFRRLKRFERY